jgi:hypothetical protein
MFSVQAMAGCTNYGDYLHWIGALYTPDVLVGVKVQGSYAYFIKSGSSGDSFLVVDLTNESAPVIVASISLPGAINGIAVSGTTVAISNSNSPHDGLFLVDISNPITPSIIGSALSGRLCRKVAISGSIAYVTCFSPSYSLEVVDISDPANPTLLTSAALPWEPYDDFSITETHAYLSGAYLMTVDISTPAAAHVVDTDYAGSGRIFCDVIVSGGYAYLSTRHSTQYSTFQVWDLANPANPQAVGGFTTTYPGGGYYPFVAYAAGVCYFGASTGNILMINVANPAAPSLIGNLPRPSGGYLRDLTVQGPNLYVLQSSYPDHLFGTAHIISVSSPSPMEPICSIDTPGDAMSVVVSSGRNSLAYVADGAAGVQVVDVTDPLNPIIIGNVNTPGIATDIVLSGSTAYVADSEFGLQVIDVSVPTAPAIIGSVDTPGLAVDLAVVDTLVYIADSNQGLRIADVANPSLPVIIGVNDILESALGVDVSGIVAYVASGADGLTALNVSDPNNPWIIGGVKNREIGNALKVDVAQGRALVTDASAGLVIVDISDPGDLQILGSMETQSTPSDVNAIGIFAYVGSGANVDLADIRDPGNPVMVGNVPIPAGAQGIFVNEFYAFVTTGAAGLQICPTQCGFDETVITDFTPNVTEGFYPVTIQFNNESIGYGLSYDWDFGDGSAHSSEQSPAHTYTQPGDFTVILTATNGTNTDTAIVVVSALTEPPTITSIDDVPNDQGGFAYVEFYHSGFDDTGLGRSELYTIQRRDGDRWVSLSSIGAYGEHYYTALAQTQGDGAESWTTSFRVIAHMDEGNWASAPMTGFSLDNIAPQAPENVFWRAPGRLAWDAVADDDFAYYRIYGADSPSFAEAEKLAVTVETEIELGGVTHGWLFVVAVDDAELESEPSSPLTTTGIPGPATVVELAPAVPNPFNPTTAIAYALPRESRARLSIYDTRGRLVLDLLDRVVPAGRHIAAWQGRDDGGRPVPSGVYFSRLEADGTVLTRRMVLVR